MPSMIFVVGFFVVAGLGVIVFGFSQMRQPDVISKRMTEFVATPTSLDEQELQIPFYQRVLIPLMGSLLKTLGKYGAKQSEERLRTNIQQAGNPGNISPTMFVGLRVFLAAALAAIIFLVVIQSMTWQDGLLYIGLGPVIGYMMPVMWLGRKITARKKNIVKALPDALDLLTISVEAGLAFDLALKRVTQKWDNELAREFKRVLSDIQLGRLRREALRDMSLRTGVEDVQTFVAAIIQADQLGVPLSKILKIQSDQMRQRRRQRAEEAAHKAPVIMLFPMVFLIFPALFIVIIGPAVPKFMNSGL